METASNGTEDSSLSIHILGPFTLWQSGKPLPQPRTRKGQWALTLLVLRKGHPVERSWLARTLWPDSPDSTALENLRTSLKDLRHILGNDADRLTGPSPRTLAFDLTGVVCDLIAFDDAIARADLSSLEQAVTLYRGPLLEGCDAEWLLPERERREQAMLGALETLAHNALALSSLESATGYLRRVVAIDPLRETAWQNLMRALAARGDHAAVTNTYRELENLLRRTLGARPDDETLRVYRSLLSPEGKADALRSASAFATRPVPPLPSSPTPLLGRTEEIDRICQMLASARLVTLTGVGGSGKTRLAIAVSERLRASPLLDGVFFLPLVDVSETERLAETIRDGLGLTRAPNVNPFTQIVNRLAGGVYVLLLDNFEHLLEGGTAFVHRLLGALPTLKILITSRQALHLRGEHEFVIPPLPVPERGEASPSLEAIRNVASVQLFLLGARARRPHFELTNDNAPTIAELCRQLDGLPLAIELAAAWVHLRSPGEMLARLENQRFDLLRSHHKDQPERHRTMRAAIEWSFRLLEPSIQEFAARLSVFRGSWTAEAAANVCDKPAVLEYLERLYDASLIVTEEKSGVIRYRYLETIRSFAEERLQHSGHYDTVRQRHFDYILHWYERANAHQDREGKWLDSIEHDLDNIRQALAWGKMAPGQGQPLLRLTTLLFGLALHHNHFREACEWYRVALDACPDAPPDLRCLALNAAGWCYYFAGDLRTARTYFEELQVIAEKSGNPIHRVHAFADLGSVARFAGEHERAHDLLTEGLVLSRAIDFHTGIIFNLSQLSGLACDQGDFETARRLGQEGILHRRSGSTDWLASISLIYQGDYALYAGDFEAARTHYTEALAITAGFNDRYHTGRSIFGLGCLARAEGDLSLAQTHFEESYSNSREVGDRITTLRSLRGLASVALEQGDVALAHRRIAETVAPHTDGRDERGNLPEALEAFAMLALAQGRHELAVRFLGCAEIGRETCRLAVSPALRRDYDRCLAELRATIDTDLFARLWTEGRTLTSEQALASTLRLVSLV